jgi:hypothetical protein
MSGDAILPTDILLARARSIRALQGGEMNVYQRALDVLKSVSQQLNAPIAIVGGLAAIHHKALVTTLDVDVVVPQEWLDDFLEIGQKHGLTVKKRSSAGWHVVVYHDSEGEVEIHVLPTGCKTPRDPDYAPPIPSPQQLGVAEGLGYASFAGWVLMKLVANRDKDRYHLTEALRNASAEQIRNVVVTLRDFDPVYMAEFHRLLRASEDEDQSNW